MHWTETQFAADNAVAPDGRSLTMQTPLTKKKTLLWISIALVIAATLDIASTYLAFQRMGGPYGEINPIVRALGGHRGRIGPALAILIGIKCVFSTLTIVWLARTQARIPSLYPQTPGDYGFFRFANHLFYGRDVSWWVALFGVPPLRRTLDIFSVPVALAIIVSGIAVSITNTLGLITSFTGILLFWVTSAVVGCLLGLGGLYLDFLTQRDHPRM